MINAEDSNYKDLVSNYLPWTLPVKGDNRNTAAISLALAELDFPRYYNGPSDPKENKYCFFKKLAGRTLVQHMLAYVSRFIELTKWLQLFSKFWFTPNCQIYLWHEHKSRCYRLCFITVSIILWVFFFFFFKHFDHRISPYRGVLG